MLEVKEEQKESAWESPSLCYDSSTICNSRNAVDLSECTTDDLVTADDPPCMDFERIIMGEKLSDLDINATQRILKQQFANMRTWTGINSLSNEGEEVE